MKVENRIHLKNNFSAIYSLINNSKNQNEHLTIEETKTNDKTIFLNEPYNIYLHSKYNPIREAEQIMQQYDLSNINHIYLIGLGLGYHLDYIITNYPNIEISVFEPNVQVLDVYLQEKVLPTNVKNIIVNFNELDNEKELIRLFSQKTITVELPVYGKLYHQEILQVQQAIKESLDIYGQSLAVNTGFQEEWVANSFLNFKEIISTPNFISEHNKQIFEEKPVIIVAAGPSLNEEMDLLKEIVEEQSAYIFAVGSAINALLDNGIKPDATFAYDPSEGQNEVLSKAKQSGDVPLIFGSTLGYGVAQNYLASKQHFILSTDSLAKNILDVPSNLVVQDAPSIAVVTLQIVKQLKMNPVILVGQNLGYLNNQHYAKGIEYSFVQSNELSEEEQKTKLVVKDVYGNDMLTNGGFKKMKDGIELVISHFNYGKIINTTKGGAKIEGAEFLNLEEARNLFLQETNIVNKEWLNNKFQYDEPIGAYNQLTTDFKDYVALLKDIIPLANSIKDDYDGNRYMLVSKNIDRFTKKFKVIVEHIVHDVVVRHGVKVQHDRFTKNYREVEYERNPKKKAQKFIEIFYKYLGSVSDFTSRLYPVVLSVHNNINQNENMIEGLD